MQRQFIAPSKKCKIIFFLVFIFIFFPAREFQAREDLQESLEELHRKFEEHQQELEQTGEEFEETRQKLQEAREQEDSILSLLDRYERQINNTRQRLRNLREKESAARSQLREVEEELETLDRLLEEREKLLRKRLRGLYKHGEMSRFQLVLGSRSMDELVVRSRYYQEIINHDQDIIESYREAKQKQQELRKERSEILQERQQLRRDVQQTLAELEETKRRRQEALDDLRNRKEFYEHRVRELENQQQQLKEMVLELQEEKSATEARLERLTHRFDSSEGELRWPVSSRRIFRPFGSWVEDGIEINNEGIDIKVEEGAEVVAVAPGSVAFARPYRGMGKVVIIQHGDNFTTLYGSLVELQVERGNEVREGEVIGRAGQTAGLDEPRLYFQVFRGREILNPEKWLE